jgi:recombination protein RecA
MSPPFKVAEFDIIYGVGISREGSLIDLGVDQGIVRKSGAWYTYEGDQLGQGKENARNFLRENPDLANEIEKRIKEKLGVGPRIDADASANGSASNASPSNSSPSNSSASNSNAGNSSSSGRPPGNGAAPSRTAATVPGVTV